MSDADKKDDATRIGGGPPAAPRLPIPGAPAGAAADSTHAGGAAPVIPSQPPAALPPAAAPPGVADADDADGDETVAVGQVAQRAPCSLQRVQPPGHAGVVYLSGATYLLGRKHGADLPLFSPTASREHARLERRADGWYIEPIEGKAVTANGSMLRAALRLEHKMRLQVGGDEFIFFDETAVVAASVSVPTPAPAAPRSSPRLGRWIAAALGLAAAALLAWLLLHSVSG